jgi:hypothetical protein
VSVAVKHQGLLAHPQTGGGNLLVAVDLQDHLAHRRTGEGIVQGILARLRTVGGSHHTAVTPQLLLVGEAEEDPHRLYGLQQLHHNHDLEALLRAEVEVDHHLRGDGTAFHKDHHRTLMAVQMNGLVESPLQIGGVDDCMHGIALEFSAKPNA